MPTTTSATDYARTALDRIQGRSVVMHTGGIVASEHPLASQAGASVLARGGSAIDAAIATNAAMGVVFPMMNGIGGDLFAIVYDAASNDVYGLNASGCAPSGLSIDVLRSRGITSMPQSGIHSVTIPGAVAGWQLLLDRFGRSSMAEALAPAIRIAEDGFPVPEIIATEWIGCETLLRKDAEATRVYLPGGKAPALGQVFRNIDLANSYRAIAASGRDAFYRGDIARRLVACSDAHDGTLTLADLAAYEAEWVTPLSTTYRGWTVYELPPNGQGIAALMMLNMLEHAPMGEYGHNSAEGLHTLIEAKKLAYADLALRVCDPAFHDVPADAMLSKAYAAQRFSEIDLDRAHPGVAPGVMPKGSDTTYISTVDRDGNMVSLIQSNFAGFGSGLVAEGTGFALQCRGGLFTMDASHVNALAPRKRPLHTIIPGLMTRGGITDQSRSGGITNQSRPTGDGDVRRPGLDLNPGDGGITNQSRPTGDDEVRRPGLDLNPGAANDVAVRIAFGIMGGWNQAQAHVQFVSNIVDHGMNIQEALEAARVTKLTFSGCDVLMESRVPVSSRLALTAKGHQIDLQGTFSNMVGGGQSVMRDYATGVNFGASDPRKDGAAIPEPFIGT